MPGLWLEDVRAPASMRSPGWATCRLLQRKLSPCLPLWPPEVHPMGTIFPPPAPWGRVCSGPTLVFSGMWLVSSPCSMGAFLQLHWGPHPVPRDTFAKVLRKGHSSLNSPQVLHLCYFKTCIYFCFNCPSHSLQLKVTMLQGVLLWLSGSESD